MPHETAPHIWVQLDKSNPVAIKDAETHIPKAPKALLKCGWELMPPEREVTAQLLQNVTSFHERA